MHLTRKLASLALLTALAACTGPTPPKSTTSTTPPKTTAAAPTPTPVTPAAPRPVAPTPAVPTPAAPSTAAPVAPAAAGATKTGVLDERGYIREWLILGPIPFADLYDAENIAKEQIPGEANLTPKAGDKATVDVREGQEPNAKTVQKQLTWIATTTSDYFFDLNEILKTDDSTGMGAYAVTYIDAPQEMTGITLSLSSNDNGELYFNGKSVSHFVGGRALSEDTEKAENLTLKQGSNVLIFKVWNDSSNWQGCVRLLDKQGNPLKNVKVRLTK